MMQTISTKQLASLFRDIRDSGSEQKVCFIIGAGASFSSNIRTGAQLAKIWFDEIKNRLTEADFNSWVAQDAIDLNNIAANYPKIYSKRFENHPGLGFDFINQEMENKRPGYGYSVLGQLLCDPAFNVVVTTNFDNLIEVALYTYIGIQPLVCGHESLAAFARPSSKRPMIAKIHRDRLFEPNSTVEGTSNLHQSWHTPLQRLFSDRIVVVIGYGGNDGSLMDFLEKEATFSNLFWCEIKERTPSEKVLQLLNDKKGKIVAIDGFDQLMLAIQQELKLGLLDVKIEATAKANAEDYRKRVEELLKSEVSSANPERQETAREISENTNEENWWTYQLKANAAKTGEEKEKAYKEGLKKFPESSELYNNYANFLKENKKDYQGAEECYKQALRISPEKAFANGNYALFLNDIRNKHDEAEPFYKKALQLAPDSTLWNVNYAIFLSEIRKKYDLAESYYKVALQIDPADSSSNEQYALFLSKIRKNYDGAEFYYKEALRLDPLNAGRNGNYGFFLDFFRKNYDEAERYYKECLRLAPADANWNGHYAVFLNVIRKNYDEAEVYYKESLRLDAVNADLNGNYAAFLKDIRKDYDKADLFYKKAIQLAPDSGLWNNHYALFLKEIRKNYDEAERYHKESLRLDPGNADFNGNYAVFLKDIRKDDEGAGAFFEKAVQLAPDSELWNGHYAIFLNHIRKSYAEAAAYYKKSLEIHPDEASWNANYAQLLLQMGQKEEAIPFLEKAFGNCNSDGLLLELWFYRYAHFPEYQEEALKKMNELIARGIRSPGWDFTGNIAQAEKEKHPGIAQLKNLAKLISEE